MPVFFDFLWKNHCSCAHILSKAVHSLKNTVLSRPYFVKKSTFSQKRALRSFFQISHENPPSVMPIFGQKTTLPKLHYIMGQKYHQDALFSNCSRKNLGLMPVVKKRPVSKKTLFLCPYFIKKRHLHDKGALMPFFSKFK